MKMNNVGSSIAHLYRCDAGIAIVVTYLTGRDRRGGRRQIVYAYTYASHETAAIKQFKERVASFSKAWMPEELYM